LTALSLCSCLLHIVYGGYECVEPGSIDLQVVSDTTLTTGNLQIVFPKLMLTEDAKETLNTVEMKERLARSLNVPASQLLVAFDFSALQINNTVTANFQLLAVDTLECPVPCFGVWSDWSTEATACDRIDSLDDDGLVGNSQRTYMILQSGNELGADCDYKNLTLENGTCCEGHWEEWSECEVSCGAGSAWRTYNVTIPSEFEGRSCEHENGEKESKNCTLEHDCDALFVEAGRFSFDSTDDNNDNDVATDELKAQCVCLWQYICPYDTGDDLWMCSDDANLYEMGVDEGDSLRELESWFNMQDNDFTCPDPSSSYDYLSDNDCLMYMSLAAQLNGVSCDLPDTIPDISDTSLSEYSLCVWIEFGQDHILRDLTVFKDNEIDVRWLIKESYCEGTVYCPVDCDGYWSDPFPKNWTLIDGSTGECLVSQFVTTVNASYGGESCCDEDLFVEPASAMCPVGYFTCGSDGSDPKCCDWDADCSCNSLCDPSSGGSRNNPFDFDLEVGCMTDLAQSCMEDVKGAGCMDCDWNVTDCPIPCGGHWNESMPCDATCEDGQEKRQYWVYRNASNNGAPCSATKWDGSVMTVYTDADTEWDYMDSRDCTVYDVDPCPYEIGTTEYKSGICNFPLASMSELPESCNALWSSYANYTSENGMDTTDLVRQFEIESNPAFDCWDAMTSIMTILMPFSDTPPDFFTGANNATCNRSSAHIEFCLEFVFPGDEDEMYGGTRGEIGACAGDTEMEYFEYITYSFYPCVETCCPVDCEGDWGDVYVNGSCYVRNWTIFAENECGGNPCNYTQGETEPVSCGVPC
jgi:hypothetical protein